METADDGVDFSASNARDWRFQLIGGFKEMCDGFFREVFRGMGLKDFRQVKSESVSLVDVAARPYTKGRPNGGKVVIPTHRPHFTPQKHNV
jgi:hypothetical protein